MQSTLNLEACKNIEETKSDKTNSKDKSKYDKNDDMSLLIEKKFKNTPKNKNTDFRNNYKNYQYDYEEDFYEPRY